jgi:hypothetical protein
LDEGAFSFLEIAWRNKRALEERMTAFTVHQGKRYRALISLGMLERFASDDIIAGRLRTAGFSDISVSGTGTTRIAEALWLGAGATAELPKQIKEVVEV